MWNRHSGAIQCFLEDDFLNSESVLTTQSHPTLCDPIGCSPAGSSAHGILQVRILVWVVVVQSLSRARLSATPWTAARQASLSFTLSQDLLKLMPIDAMHPPQPL